MTKHCDQRSCHSQFGPSWNHRGILDAVSLCYRDSISLYNSEKHFGCIIKEWNIYLWEVASFPWEGEHQARSSVISPFLAYPIQF